MAFVETLGQTQSSGSSSKSVLFSRAERPEKEESGEDKLLEQMSTDMYRLSLEALSTPRNPLLALALVTTTDLRL